MEKQIGMFFTLNQFNYMLESIHYSKSSIQELTTHQKNAITSLFTNQYYLVTLQIWASQIETRRRR